ncbi:14369_t:CDS:2, partial [Cetraspora pellucida]
EVDFEEYLTSMKCAHEASFLIKYLSSYNVSEVTIPRQTNSARVIVIALKFLGELNLYGDRLKGGIDRKEPSRKGE